MTRIGWLVTSSTISSAYLISSSLMGFHDASGIQTPTPRCIWQEQMVLFPVLSKHFTGGVEGKILLLQTWKSTCYESETRITSRSRTVSHSDRFQGQQLEGSSQTSLMVWLLRKSMTGRTRESFDRYKTVRSWRCSKNGKLCNSRALDLYTPASTTPYASGTLIYASAIPAARNSESLSESDIVAKQQRFRSARERDVLQKIERKSESGKLTCHHGCARTNRRHVLLLPMRIKEVGRDARGMDKRREGGCIVDTLPRQAAFRRLLARGVNVGKTQGAPHSHPSPVLGVTMQSHPPYTYQKLLLRESTPTKRCPRVRQGNGFARLLNRSYVFFLLSLTIKSSLLVHVCWKICRMRRKRSGFFLEELELLSSGR